MTSSNSLVRRPRRRTSPISRPRLEALEPRALMDGNPDPTFGNNGFVGTHVGVADAPSIASDVAVYPTTDGSDGKVIAVGVASPKMPGWNADYDFALVRYNPDGTLDTTFNGTGKVTTAFSSGDDWAMSVELAGTKILAAGVANQNGGFALARYNDNGSLDTTFGSKGKVVTKLSSTGINAGYEMKVDASSRIVMAGVTGSSTNAALGLVRYNSAGALDTSFGQGGKVVTQFSLPLAAANSGPEQMDLAITPNTTTAGSTAGTIVVVASLYVNDHTPGSLLVARYTTSGVLDSSFDGNGQLVLPLQDVAASPSVVVQNDGRIVIAYKDGGSLQVARLNTDGTFDTSFDGDGRASVDLAGSYFWPGSVAIQPGGQILVAGNVSPDAVDSSSFFVTRLTPGGALDTTYGNGGFAFCTANQTSRFDNNVHLAMASNGKVVVAGESQTRDAAGNTLTRNFGVARFDGPATQTSSMASLGMPRPLASAVPQALVDAALVDWRAAGVGAGGSRENAVRIADRGGPTPGRASGDIAWLGDGAGRGWPDDATPVSGTAFARRGGMRGARRW